jgi:TRAP-type uncharacterized transport system substrate-binding protein
MTMKSLQIELPFWVRAVLLAGVFCIIAGAGLIAYRYYQRPVTLTVAVGSLDGEARQVASLIAGRLATIESPVRLKVVNSGSVLDAAKAFASGQADLAVVRADVGDLSQARTIAITAHGVVMIVAPPGSSITSIAKLRDHTVGVVGGEINHGVVEVLKKEYDLGRANVTFKDIAPADVRRAVQAKEVAALLLVMPLTDRYLSFVKGLFREGANSQPVLIPIDSAGAIADVKGPYESFDIPKGTLRGAPPVPDDDVTTLRVGYYLVANRHLNATVAADLARRIMGVRRDLVGEEPLLSGLAAPELDADAYPRGASRRRRVFQRHPGKLHGPLWQRDLSDADGARRAGVDLRRGLALSRRSRQRGRASDAGCVLRAAGTDPKNRRRGRIAGDRG